MTSSTLAPHPDAPRTAEHEHEHGWSTESAHRTSEGTVVYVRCTGCGARRVDVEPAVAAPPTAASAVVTRVAR